MKSVTVAGKRKAHQLIQVSMLKYNFKYINELIEMIAR